MELWDDCPPMGDQVKYREALVTIFIEGKEPPPDPEARNEKPDVNKPLPSSALSALDQMRERFGFGKPAVE